MSRLAAANAARQARQVQKRYAFNLTGKRRGNSPKVQRNSYLAGDREQREWRMNNVFGAAERFARIKAIREWNHTEKKAGQPWGPLGPNGERIIDYLFGRRCFRTGQLDPSIGEIASTLKLCVQTVVSTLKRLIDAGLLQKLRRTQRIEDAEPDGPQVEQISNAYWFGLPKAIAARVKQLLAKGGKPVDQEQHEQDQAEQVAAMMATLSAEDLAAFHAGDMTVLAKALQGLGRAVDQQRPRFYPLETTPIEQV